MCYKNLKIFFTMLVKLMTNNQSCSKKTLITNAMGLKRLSYSRNWDVCLMSTKSLYRDILAKCTKIRESQKNQRLTFSMQAVICLKTTTAASFYLEITRKYSTTLLESGGHFIVGSFDLNGTLIKTYNNMADREEIAVRVRDDRGQHCIHVHLNRIELDYNSIITHQDTMNALESLISTAERVLEAKPYVMPIFQAATTGNLGETASNLAKKMPTHTTYRSHPKQRLDV